MAGERLLRRAPGFWTDATLRSEVFAFMTAHGMSRPPSEGDLNRAGRGDLRRAIEKAGGFQALWRQLGFEVPSRINRAWDDPRLRSEILAFMADHRLNRAPFGPELDRAGRTDIRNAIHRAGGFPAVAKRLGLEHEGPRPGPRSNPWSDARLEAEILAFMTKHGFDRLPNANEFNRSGRSDLRNAVSRAGGPEPVARRLGVNYIPIAEQRSAMLQARLSSGKRWKSQAEYKNLRRLLEPLGLSNQADPTTPALRLGNHTFDWADRAGRRVVEHNGCCFHDHRRITPACAQKYLVAPRDELWAKDERIRAIARRHDLILLELWDCEPTLWPQQIEAWLRRHWPGQVESWHRRLAELAQAA